MSMMLSARNRISCKVVATILVLTCVGLIWLAVSSSSCHRFLYEVRISSKEESPLIAYGLLGQSPPSNSTETPSTSNIKSTVPSGDVKVFDSTMLTEEDDRHVERLSRLEATVAGMRDFLVRHLGSSKCDRNCSQATLVKAREYLRVMEADIDVIKETDQATRRSVAKMQKLRNFVQASIDRMQNPTNCKSAPKLLCQLENPWGFAASVHDVLWCFVAALQMNRTVILNSTKWHYAPGTRGWSSTFQPVTGPTCDNAGSENMIIKGYPGYDSSPKERSKILDMPSSIMTTLAANHGDPYAWWYGQVMGYILRLQNSTLQTIEGFKKKSGYKHPIVAMHIRRTDKKREASYHDVGEYMQHAEDFFSRLELTRAAVQRRVFVATDEPSVIKEIKKKFPSYVVISNDHSAREAFDMKARTKSSALTGMVTDIHLLAHADRLVCALSSGFCRIAYELMQARHAEAGLDATRKAVSVDVEYFYAYVPFPPRRTLYRNERVFTNELRWTSPGGLVERSGDFASLHEAKDKKYADGFNTGRTVGSSEDGNRMVFPRFKTTQTYRVMQYNAFNVSRIEL